MRRSDLNLEQAEGVARLFPDRGTVVHNDHEKVVV